jgi:hypothetical protein
MLRATVNSQPPAGEVQHEAPQRRRVLVVQRPEQAGIGVGVRIIDGPAGAAATAAAAAGVTAHCHPHLRCRLFDTTTSGGRHGFDPCRPQITGSRSTPVGAAVGVTGHT